MKVLVAIDESEGSLYALQWTLENIFLHHAPAAPAEDQPMLTVVHVQPPFQQPFTAVPVGPVLFATPAVMDSVKKAQEVSAAEVVSHASKLCEQYKHIRADTVVIRGNPKEMIVEAVEEMNADLLVVGSRGLGQIKRAFLGSVSDYCAHHAKCPVLIVRPPKPAKK